MLQSDRVGKRVTAANIGHAVFLGPEMFAIHAAVDAVDRRQRGARQCFFKRLVQSVTTIGFIAAQMPRLVGHARWMEQDAVAIHYCGQGRIARQQ